MYPRCLTRQPFWALTPGGVGPPEIPTRTPPGEHGHRVTQAEKEV